MNKFRISATGLLVAGALIVTAIPVPAMASEAAAAQEAAQATAAQEAAAGATGNESTPATTGDAITKTQATEAGSAEQKTETITVKVGYEHDPMENPKAAQDILVNPNAVYGYSPSPLSTRLKEFVDAIDWTNKAQVEEARKNRIHYIESGEVLYEMIETMMDEGKSTEEIARAVSAKRNQLRLDAYIGDPDGLARVKKSNLDTYGDENGPTIDYLYKKYGSWEVIIQKALSSNPGMDACLGLYDDYYEFYSIEEKVTLKAQEEVTTVDPTTGVRTYTVVSEDNLWAISQKVYGDGTKWEKIYNANQDVLKGSTLLTVGMKLVIPELQQETAGAAKAEAAASAAATEATTQSAAEAATLATSQTAAEAATTATSQTAAEAATEAAAGAEGAQG